MRFAALATCFLVAAGTAQAGSLLVNGDFETSFNTPGIRNGGQVFGNLNSSGPSWNIWRDIPGWTTLSGDGIEIQSNRTLGQIDAHSDSHYVELDSNNNSSMMQQVILQTGLHELSFYFSPRTHKAYSNGIEFGIDGALAKDVISGPNRSEGIFKGGWTQVTRQFNVTTAGSYSLTFSAVGRSDSYGGLIDTVALQRLAGPPGAPGPAPIPLPGSVALLGSAAAGLVVMRYLKRS